MPGILRKADIGILSGLLGGLVIAAVSRIAMRWVAIVDSSGMEQAGVNTGFTGETIWLMIIVPLSAAKGGLIFVLIRGWLPGPRAMNGLAFGILVLLVIGVPLLFIDEAFSYGPTATTLLFFGGLFVTFGIAVSAIVGGLERVWTADGRGRTVTIVASVPLVLAGIVSVPIVVPFFH